MGTAVAALLVLSSVASAGSPGFLTAQPAMLHGSAAGSSVLPIITVGDTLPNGYRYEAIPDGIGRLPNGRGTLDVLVSHETSLLPGNSVSAHFIPVPRSIALGNQTPLENWSNANNVFQFIRVEDMAYDKNDPRVVYLADTGEPRAIPDPATGRLRRGPSGTQGPYPNGRIFKLVFNGSDPLVVDSMPILIGRSPVQA